jgi:hypothetical protein
MPVFGRCKNSNVYFNNDKIIGVINFFRVYEIICCYNLIYRTEELWQKQKKEFPGQQHFEQDGIINYKIWKMGFLRIVIFVYFLCSSLLKDLMVLSKASLLIDAMLMIFILSANKSTYWSWNMILPIEYTRIPFNNNWVQRREYRKNVFWAITQIQKLNIKYKLLSYPKWHNARFRFYSSWLFKKVS